MITQNDLFKDMADTLEYWTETAIEATTNKNTNLIWTDKEESFRHVQEALITQSINREDVKQVFSECLRGFAFSLLVMLDGGTTLSEKGRIFLIDEDGKQFGDGLQDKFISYLLDSIE